MAFQMEPHAIVAIPACNEADRIATCLAALACQRDLTGAPLRPGSFSVLVFANNCSDGTAEVAREIQRLGSLDLIVITQTLAVDDRNAGAARRIAMDHAADMLDASGTVQGVILTTDADSAVCSTWVCRTLAAMLSGADAVAGYIEAQPTEIVALGEAFLQRGRLEDTYLARIAEISALCDPLEHDPWPNHRVSSGASLAVSLAAYRAIGGLPKKAVGEDAALSEALQKAGFKVRHDLAITVTTSCRFDGRAAGGAADTMKQRFHEPDAVCDGDMERAVAVVRRALWKGALRQWYARRPRGDGRWSERLGLSYDALHRAADTLPHFEQFWAAVEGASVRLRRRPPLRPSDLPAQIERAEVLIQRVRRRVGQRQFSDTLTALPTSAPAATIALQIQAG